MQKLVKDIQKHMCEGPLLFTKHKNNFARKIRFNSVKPMD